MAFDSLQEAKEPTIDDVFKPISTLDVTEGLKSGLIGHPEVGKTGVIGTMSFLPGCEPLYVVDTEWGTRQVFNTWFPEKDIRVFEVKVLAKDPTKIDAHQTFNKIERALHLLVGETKGSIAIDSFSDIYYWMNEWVEQTAKRHKSKSSGEEFMMRTEWGKRNKRYRNMVFNLLNKPMHVIVTGQMKAVYTSGGEETKEETAAWLTRHKHWMDVLVEMQKWERPGSVKYMSTIRKCRMHRASNYQIEDLNYVKLLHHMQQEFGVEVQGVNYGELKEINKEIIDRFKMKPNAIKKAFGDLSKK
ncbi:hypothetical protein D4R42_04680 [bacterium]|nr:MAG: hypothetical protein D4R42_04680 [bacterium]